MYNSPHEEESLPRVLPGKLLSLDAQCRKDRGTRYFRLENISLILTSQTLAAPASRMTESAPSSSASTPGPATASPTDQQRRGRDVETTRSDLITSPHKSFFSFLPQMCLNGKCVAEHENAIDYGDGFLRRTGSVEVETYREPDSRVSSSTRSRVPPARVLL